MKNDEKISSKLTNKIVEYKIKEAWDRKDLPDKIISKLDNANVFFSEEWFNYTKARNENICYLWNDIYILVIRVKKVAFLRGGILESEPFKILENENESNEKKFITDCCNFIKKNKKIDWVQTEISANFLTYPENAVVYGAGNFILDIENASEEELFKKVHSKNRNMIRRGEKEKIKIIREGNQLVEDYKKIEDQVWKRSNSKVRDLEHYKQILDNMPNTSSLVIGYKDNIPEAGAIFLYNKQMGYYYHGASKDKQTPGAHNYVIWEEILYLKSLGVKKINFVGYRRKTEINPNVKAFGIQNFKERFGGDVLETYGFKFVCSKFKYIIYRLTNVLLYHNSYKDVFDKRSKHYPEYNKI